MWYNATVLESTGESHYDKTNKRHIIVNSNWMPLIVFSQCDFALYHGGFVLRQWLGAQGAYPVLNTRLEKLILNAWFKLAGTKEQKQRRFSEIPVKPSALESLRSVFQFPSLRLPPSSFRICLARWPEYGARWTLSVNTPIF